jgi:hypothetical protein
LFYVGDDSRSNPFKKRGVDVIQAQKDPLEVLVGTIIKFRAKRFKEVIMDFFKIHELRWTQKHYASHLITPEFENLSKRYPINPKIII